MIGPESYKHVDLRGIRPGAQPLCCLTSEIDTCRGHALTGSCKSIDIVQRERLDYLHESKRGTNSYKFYT